MNNREVIKLIKNFKDEPEFGGDFDFKKSWEKFADQYSFEKDFSDFKLTWHDYANYFIHVGSKSILQPVSLALSAFVIVFGGWVATVNASFASVPGDFLYPVKLATERVQITLAAGNEQRARLHTEFAGRRLNEVMEITASSSSGNDVRVREAVASFKQSVNSANEAISNLATTSPETVADVAMILDQKMEAMVSALSESGNTTSAEQHVEQISEAQNVAEASDQFLTETIVSSNETAQQQSADEYLQDSFKKDLAEIENRSVNLLVRINAIESAMLAGKVSYDYSKNLQVIKDMTEGSDENLIKATNFFVAGGWRRVLEIVTDLKTKLSNAEVLVLEMEIEISTATAPPLP